MQYIVKKKVLCSAEKGSVIWAEPNSRSSAEQFCQTKRSVGKHFILTLDKYIDKVIYGTMHQSQGLANLNQGV